VPLKFAWKGRGGGKKGFLASWFEVVSFSCARQ